MPETLVELDTPTDIGMKKIPLYTDSISFNATLPFNHKRILAEATDLRTIPNLEEKVLAHYNMVRQMMIDGNCYEYNKIASCQYMGFDGNELSGERGFEENIYRFRRFIPFFMQSYRLDCRTNTKL